MPTYENLQRQINNRQRAKRLLRDMGIVYNRGRFIKAMLELYLAGTDEDFNAVMDEVFTPAERQELNQMLTPLAAMIDDWEANHLGLLFPEQE